MGMRVATVRSEKDSKALFSNGPWFLLSARPARHLAASAAAVSSTPRAESKTALPTAAPGDALTPVVILVTLALASNVGNRPGRQAVQEPLAFKRRCRYLHHAITPWCLLSMQ
jgi:hypothetical protein